MWIIIKACGTATTYVPDCSLLGLTASAKDTRAPSRNEPDLFSRARVSCHGGWMPDVLVVTSAVRMLHRVHRGATNLRPTIPLHAVFVKAVSRLEHWLVHATTPTIARQVDGMVFRDPEGRRSLVCAPKTKLF